MTTLAPLESLYELNPDAGVNLPLPSELSNLYGHLQFPPHGGRSYVIANFVSTLDGVVSLGIPGRSGGGEISGFNPYDRMVMGLLRAAADAVIVGAGTLRAVSADHVWNAAYIFPTLAEAYQQLRAAMGKPEPPLNVIVTARAEIDLSLRVFQSGEVPVLIVTTPQGQEHLSKQPMPASVQVAVVEESAAAGELSARAVLNACVNHLRHAAPSTSTPKVPGREVPPRKNQGRWQAGSGQRPALLRGSDLILVEGGPHLMGNFLTENCLNELFLTFAPQIAGRDNSTERPGLIAGKRYAPEQPLWGALTSVKRAGSHLFLRYSLKESSVYRSSH